ncbi:MAG: FAD-dependent monooxygenase [Pseudomonadota bacterium]
MPVPAGERFGVSAQGPAPHAVIAGGGIAGLAAAAGLAGAGWRVTLFERRQRIAEEQADPLSPGGRALGAGIQMSPNACRCLKALGAFDAVAASAFRPQAAVLREGRSGRVIYRAPLGAAAEARWGAPYLHVYRADLVAALAAAATAAGAVLRPATQVLDAEEHDSHVAIEVGPVREGDDAAVSSQSSLASPSSPAEAIEADLLLVADGLGSRLRATLFGDAPRRFTGQTAWRAVLAADTLPEAARMPPDATVWAGPGRHVVTYYLRGGALLNLVAVEEASLWESESWSTEGDPARLRAAFAGFDPALTSLISAVEQPLLWGLFDRDQPPRWHTRRSVLLGDAVHPMLPFMAQGAAMALEDAAVLAAVLSEMPECAATLGAQLAKYEAARRARATRVQRVSRENGTLFHRADGLRRRFDHALIGAVSRLAPSLAAGRLDWLYGHDALGGLGSA